MQIKVLVAEQISETFGRTDLRYILADSTNANRVWHWLAMTRKEAKQFSVAFRQHLEMQMGFDIG